MIENMMDDMSDDDQWFERYQKVHNIDSNYYADVCLESPRYPGQRPRAGEPRGRREEQEAQNGVQERGEDRTGVYMRIIEDLKDRINERDHANRDMKSKIENIRNTYTQAEEYHNRLARVRQNIRAQQTIIDDSSVYITTESYRIEELEAELQQLTNQEVREKKQAVEKHVDTIKKIKKVIVKKERDIQHLMSLV